MRNDEKQNKRKQQSMTSRKDDGAIPAWMPGAGQQPVGTMGRTGMQGGNR